MLPVLNDHLQDPFLEGADHPFDPALRPVGVGDRVSALAVADP